MKKVDISEATWNETPLSMGRFIRLRTNRSRRYKIDSGLGGTFTVKFIREDKNTAGEPVYVYENITNPDFAGALYYFSESEILKQVQIDHCAKSLLCGCCGASFMTWPEYEDQDQDAGYGICQRCQDDQEVRNHEQYQEMIDQVQEALKPENAEKFKAFTYERKVLKVLQLMDKGAFKWTIGGR